jgi:hypothetical protein
MSATLTIVVSLLLLRVKWVGSMSATLTTVVSLLLLRVKWVGSMSAILDDKNLKGLFPTADNAIIWGSLGCIDI